MYTPHAGSTLASAFKRVQYYRPHMVVTQRLHMYIIQVLLSNDETLQLSGVQCVAEVLSHQPQYGQTLLQADIAGM